MKSSHQKRKSAQKSQSYQRLNIESILSSQRSPHKSVMYDKANNQFRQNSFSKNDKFLIELPKIFPLHKKLMNIKNKQVEFLKFNDRRFQLRGFKYMQGLELIQDSTIDASDMEKSNITIKKKQSSSCQYNIFSELILKTNKIDRFSPIKNTKLKVYVQEGNNSRLIKQLLRKRPSIKLVSQKNDADLVWTRFSDYNSLDKYSKYTQSYQKQYKCHNNTPSINKNYIQQDFIQSYRKLSQLPLPNNFLHENKSIQINTFFMHNHLKNHQELSDKKNLFKNIRTYCQSNNIPQATIIPKTYHIGLTNNPTKKEDLETKINQILNPTAFKDGKISQNSSSSYNSNSFFVIKPGEDTNRGQGITVVKGQQNILKAVQQLQKIGKSSLIQQYINPLLYKNRKFDIRCYVLVTSVFGQLHAYWYKQGYLRTCCKQFNYDPSNIYGHLTNDAVQKKHKDYGKFQQANKLSFNDLELILTQTQKSRQQVIKQMKTLATHSIKSVQNKLKGEKNIIGFEIFGYDFLIDDAGKVWLIEINTNPCLEFAGSLLSRIIWHMVDNSIKIAVDPFLDSDPKKQYQNYLDLNKYECIV